MTANITPKTLTVTGLSAADKFYDGTTTAAVTGTAALLAAEAAGGATDDGKPYTGDTVTVSGTAAGTFAQREPGIAYSVAVSGVSLGGAQVANYTATPTLTGTISDTKTDSGTTTITAANTDHNFALYLDNGKLLANTASTDSVNGTGTIAVNSGATLGGTGKVGGATVNTGGTIAPGASVGTLNSGPVTWSGGGNYEFEINDATGSIGSSPGWDLLNISGALTVAATSESKFTIKLITLNGTSPIAHWDARVNRTWRIATGTAAVSGFAAGAFTLDTSAFITYNDLAGGSFTIEQSSDTYGVNLVLTRNPVRADLAAYSRAWGTYTRVSIANLLSTYTEGDNSVARELVSVGTGSHSTVPAYSGSMTNGYIMLAPSANDALEDYAYTVWDPANHANTATNILRVSVVNAVGGTRATIEGDGTLVTVTFFGMPEFRYQVEKTTSITTPSWVAYGDPQTADSATGKLVITDTVANASSAWYRLVQAHQ